MRIVHLFHESRLAHFAADNILSSGPDGLPKSVSENSDARLQSDQRLLKIQKSIDPKNNTARFIERRLMEEKIENVTKTFVNAELQLIESGRPANPGDSFDVQRAREERQAATRMEAEKTLQQAGIALGTLAFSNAAGKSIVLLNWLDEKGPNISVQLTNVQSTSDGVTLVAEYRVDGETVRKTVAITNATLRMIGSRIVERARNSARNREEMDAAVVNAITNSTTIAIGLHEALTNALSK